MDIRTVGVVGSGTMGAGIAIVAARAGFTTIVYDTDQATLDRAAGQTESFFAKSVERKKLSREQADDILEKVTRGTDADAMAACDVVIEAVFESLPVKHEVLARLDGICPQHTVFASNTSTLSITEIAAGSGRPDRTVGMHFCLPAQLMKLVEMSPGIMTSDETFEQAYGFCEALGQMPVKTKDSPGFILNYVVVPLNNEAIRMVEAGIASPAEIDKAFKKGLGNAMGPLELLDLVGLDTQIRLCDAFYPVTNDPRHAPPPLLRRMVAANRLGRKTGQGFYTYDRDAMFGG